MGKWTEIHRFEQGGVTFGMFRGEEAQAARQMCVQKLDAVGKPFWEGIDFSHPTVAPALFHELDRWLELAKDAIEDDA